MLRGTRRVFLFIDHEGELNRLNTLYTAVRLSSLVLIQMKKQNPKDERYIFYISWWSLVGDVTK